MNTIEDIAKKVANKLNIDSELPVLLKIIREKKNIKDISKNDTKLLDQIDKLLAADDEIEVFGRQFEDELTKTNFNQLKINLGKLQILVLLKNLEKSNNSSEILNSFISVLNNKVTNINNILLDQQGGANNISNTKFFNNYIRYKWKYELLKFKLKI